MPQAVPLVTVAGNPIPPECLLVSAEVVHEVGRVPYARIILIDGDLPSRTFPALNNDALVPGAAVKISVRVDETTTPLFAGLIVRLRMEVRGGSPRLVIECKDKAWRLTRPRRSAVYPEGSDADAVGAVLTRAGVERGELADAGLIHPQLVQYDATDWDFILARAEATGMAVTVKDGKLSMQPWSVSGAAALTVELGLNAINDIELELDATTQPESIEAVGWDLPQGALTEAAAATLFDLAQGDVDAADSAAALGFGTATLTHLAPLPTAELRAWASARLARERLAMLRGRLNIGGTAIDPLDLIELKGVSARFAGTAVISGVRHVVETNSWSTDVQLGLPQSTPASGASSGAPLPAARGLRIGVVHQFESDPAGEQRVRVMLPGVGAGDGLVWARLATPEAGSKRGYLFRPMPGDEVVVGFLADDPREPVVLGALYGSKNAPLDPFATASADNEAKGFGSANVSLEIIDKSDKSGLSLKAKGSSLAFAVESGAESITLADGNGNQMVFDKDGIAFVSAKDFKIDASGDVIIKGTQIGLN
jgi:phage protein D